MISKLAICLTQYLVQQSAIGEDDKDLYIYGFFVLLSRLFLLIVTVLLGLLFGVIWESVCFYIMFIALRSYAGGIHAKTEAKCTVMSTMAILMSVSMIKFSKEYALGSIISWIMIATGSLSIFLFSPADTPEKTLDAEEYRHFRKISLVVLLICVCIFAYGVETGKNEIKGPVTMSVFLEGVLLVCCKLSN